MQPSPPPRGSKLGDTPPLVLERLLEGLGPGVTAGQLDVLQVGAGC